MATLVDRNYDTFDCTGDDVNIPHAFGEMVREIEATLKSTGHIGATRIAFPRIPLIRYLRDITPGIGLKDAKDIVDHYIGSMHA